MKEYTTEQIMGELKADNTKSFTSSFDGDTFIVRFFNRIDIKDTNKWYKNILGLEFENYPTQPLVVSEDLLGCIWTEVVE